MNIVVLKERTDELILKLVNIWEDSVKYTHLFLSNDEIDNIKKYVPTALMNVKNLFVVKNELNEIVAFMGVQDKKNEMLFIKNSERRKGIGRSLVEFGIKNYQVNQVVVNEQNENARKFYEYMGFSIYDRSEFDEQGNPYPILYLKI